MAKRIFVAMPISQKLQTGILKFQEKWHTLPVRWLKGYNLHVTLVPPWEEENIDGVITKLKTAESFEQFSIQFSQVCYGPSGEILPRLIWAVGTPTERANLLKESMEKTFGHKSNYHPWVMHLTLAKFDPANFKSLPKTFIESVIWSQMVTSVVLMESVKTAEGTDYKILAASNLK